MADGVQRLVDIPFDSSSKYMAVLVDDGDQRLILVKGAPEVIVQMCTTELDASGQPRAFEHDRRPAASANLLPALHCAPSASRSSQCRGTSVACAMKTFAT